MGFRRELIRSQGDPDPGQRPAGRDARERGEAGQALEAKDRATEGAGGGDVKVSHALYLNALLEIQAYALQDLQRPLSKSEQAVCIRQLGLPVRRPSARRGILKNSARKRHIA